MALSQVNPKDKKVKPSTLQRAAQALGIFTDVLGGISNISKFKLKKPGDIVSAGKGG